MSKQNWHPIDASAARKILAATNSPGLVQPLHTNVLPTQLKAIAGVASYYVNAFASSQLAPNGMSIGGELLVARTHGNTTKNYNFAYASSSCDLYFNGPYIGFGHHVTSGQSVDVNSLFGQTPFSNKNKT